MVVGGNSQTSTHLCSPEKHAQLGEEAGEGREALGHSQPVPQPLVTSLGPLSELKQSGWAPLGPASGSLNLLFPLSGTFFPRSPHYFLPASFVSIQLVTPSDRPSLTTLFEYDLWQRSASIYSLSLTS
jgi:hypothetical protein